MLLSAERNSRKKGTGLREEILLKGQDYRGDFPMLSIKKEFCLKVHKTLVMCFAFCKAGCHYILKCLDNNVLFVNAVYVFLIQTKRTVARREEQRKRLTV